ncbi:S1 family peptidase, partial [Streptomyces lunaelactis]|nr:S1 family peptidase [Streptomyces lunaelactis]
MRRTLRARICLSVLIALPAVALGSTPAGAAEPTADPTANPSA